MILQPGSEDHNQTVRTHRQIHVVTVRMLEDTFSLDEAKIDKTIPDRHARAYQTDPDYCLTLSTLYRPVEITMQTV